MLLCCNVNNNDNKDHDNSNYNNHVTVNLSISSRGIFVHFVSNIFAFISTPSVRLSVSLSICFQLLVLLSSLKIIRTNEWNRETDHRNICNFCNRESVATTTIIII